MQNYNEIPPIIWVLLDDRAGNINQAVGLAEALKVPYIIKNIRYNKKIWQPNFLRGQSLKGVDIAKSDKLKDPWPQFVISAGRRLGPVARYIKEQTGGRCAIIQLMWPGFPSGDYDFVAIPTHDDSHRHKSLHKTLGAPNRINAESLSQAGKMWEKTLSEKAPPPPYIALLVGGDTKKGKFTPQIAAELGKLASDFANAKKFTLLISASRRTSPEAIKALKDAISCPYYFYDPATERANPYVAFLALSSSIIVTGDSISMCSESCSSGKPVFIYSPPEITPKKHQKFHEDLYTAKHALPFSITTLAACNHFQAPKVPLQEAEDLARLIREIYFD